MAEELQGCEHCSTEFLIETMTMMGDYWFCQGCYDGWKAEFDRCDHHWTPEESEFGEHGRYCDKCSGFQLFDPEPKSRRACGMINPSEHSTFDDLGKLELALAQRDVAMQALNQIAWMDEFLGADAAREMMTIARETLSQIRPHVGASPDPK